MEFIIDWKGIDSRSAEHCCVTNISSGKLIRSEVRGSYNAQDYYLAYEIETDFSWQTNSVRINALVAGEPWHCVLERKAATWSLDRTLMHAFDAAAYPDISLTPFTNTLPVLGRQWNAREQTIEVIYFDVLKRQISAERQRYRRITAKEFRFSTWDKSFRSNIMFDDDGLVTFYPGLFERIGKQQFNGENKCNEAV